MKITSTVSSLMTCREWTVPACSIRKSPGLHCEFSSGYPHDPAIVTAETDPLCRCFCTIQPGGKRVRVTQRPENGSTWSSANSTLSIGSLTHVSFSELSEATDDARERSSR